MGSLNWWPGRNVTKVNVTNKVYLLSLQCTSFSGTTWSAIATFISTFCICSISIDIFCFCMFRILANIRNIAQISTASNMNIGFDANAITEDISNTAGPST
eukprot:NODE_491_length_7770_cov_0.866771.p8 type:complete len:101 gc:universal NODE_491_length_7770_cov_0.866771:3443-3141(-)